MPNVVIRLPMGSKQDLPISSPDKPVLLASDSNSLYITDNFNTVLKMSDMHVGDSQPLGNIKVWHDTNNMQTLVNTGMAWKEQVNGVVPVANNYGGFLDQVDISLTPGVYFSSTGIQLRSAQGYPIYYTVDNTAPTASSTRYINPIPVFTGTLRTISVGELADAEVSAAYTMHTYFRFDSTYVDDYGDTNAILQFNTANITSTVHLFVDATADLNITPDYYTDTNNIYEYINPGMSTYEDFVELNIQLYYRLFTPDGTFLEEVAFALLPSVPTISENAGILSIAPPLQGLLWHLCATNTGLEPTLTDSRQVLAIDTAEVNLTVLIPNDSWKVKLINEVGPVVSNTLNIVMTNAVQLRVCSGYDVTFVKIKADDPLVVFDTLSDTVALSRFNAGGPIVNILQETAYDGTLSPLGTKWAFSGLNGNNFDIVATDYASLIFDDFPAAAQGNPPSIVGLNGVCFLVDSNTYFDVIFTVWGQGSANSGKFTYTRATLV